MTTAGGIAPDTAAMRVRAELLVGPDPELFLWDDLTSLVGELRGDVMVLIPAVEDSARHLASDAPARLAAEASVLEARRRMDAVPGLTLPGAVRHGQELARSVEALCSHWERLARSASVEAWTPPTGASVKLLECGRWWDAVRTTASLGYVITEALQGRAGAVVQDTYARRYYFLIRPGSADEWGQIPQIDVRGNGTYIGVPPVSWTAADRQLRWIRPLTSTDYLTPAHDLHAEIRRHLAMR